MPYFHRRMGMGFQKARLERRKLYNMAVASSVSGGSAGAFHDSAYDTTWQSDDSLYWISLRSKLISFVSLIPLALAGMIAADRVRTNHHFPADVVGGAVLGSSLAAFVHFLWF